ncbi:MAG: tetratricopeptide repeat protein, partial [Desulfuromonadales bacterium]
MINKEKHLENAQKFIAKGQVSKAIKEYQSVVAAFPKDVRNRQKLAELLSRDKRNDEAMAEYEAVAKHYTDTGFYLKSIAVFKQMQKLDPSRVDIYYSLADMNEKQGLVGNALTEYRNLVAYYDKHDMPQEAIKVLDKMLALDPGNLNFSAKIAECYMAVGQETEALEKFQEIIETLSENGENSKIIKLYERFMEFCPEQGTARLPLARALLNSGSYDKAIQILKSLLKASPDDLDINRCLSDAYVALQDFANARLTLKHLLKQHQDDLDLRENYLRVCIDGGELELARDRLEEWKDDFFQADRLDMLQGFYRDLSKLMPDDVQVAASLSVLHEALGETDGPSQLARPGDVPEESPETTDDAVLDAAIDDVEPLDMTGDPTAFEDMTSTDEDTLPDQEVELELELDLADYEPDPLIDKEPADGPAVADPDRVAADTADDQESVEVEIELDLEHLDDLELELNEDLPDENAGAETDSETVTASDTDVLTMAAADVEELDTISEIAAPSDSTEIYTEDFGLNLEGDTDDTEQLDSGIAETPFDEIEEEIPEA